MQLAHEKKHRRSAALAEPHAHNDSSEQLRRPPLPSTQIIASAQRPRVCEAVPRHVRPTNIAAAAEYAHRTSSEAYRRHRRDFRAHISDLFANKGISLSASKKLGSGRYSKVITGQTTRGRIVAIKIINKDYLGSEYRKKFLPREIENWKTLHHKYIVTLAAYYEALNHVFLVMEYGPGGDLLSYVQTFGMVPEDICQTWTYQITSALHYMHGRDLAHRDLKLENIVLFPNCVKIADFGFSRKIENELSMTHCGSKSYSAPEILMGVPYNALQADIWSLGVVAFVMATDSMPFSEIHSNSTIVQYQRQQRYHYPIRCKLSSRGRTFIKTLLSYSPNDRPTTFDVLTMSWVAKGAEGRVEEQPVSISTRKSRTQQLDDASLSDRKSLKSSYAAYPKSEPQRK